MISLYITSMHASLYNINAATILHSPWSSYPVPPLLLVPHAPLRPSRLLAPRRWWDVGLESFIRLGTHWTAGESKEILVTCILSISARYAASGSCKSSWNWPIHSTVISLKKFDATSILAIAGTFHFHYIILLCSYSSTFELRLLILLHMAVFK